MKRSISFISLLLGMLFLASVLIACDSKSENDNGRANENETNASDERDMIVVDGVAKYTLVYPDNASSSVKAAMNSFLDAIKQATGVTLETKTDYLKRGALYDSQSSEILFGRTGYDETKQALKTIEASQFTIQKIGNKLVVVSPTDTLLENAVKYFTGTLIPANLEESNGKKSLCVAQYTSEKNALSNEDMIGSTPLADYVIIYETERAGYGEIATRLSEIIKEAFDVILPVYADNRREESAAEILIGKTNRQISQTLYTEAKPKLMTYKVVLKGYKLQIISGGPYSARECVDYLRFSLSTLKNDGEYFATDLAPDTKILSSSADLRIMTSNILAARWGEDSGTESAKIIPPVVQRVEIYAAVLAKYQPDAVGLQEADQKWINQLPAYLTLLKNDYGLEYTWVFKEQDGVQNLTSILYRSDKYELVDSGVQVNSYWNVAQKGYHLRLYTWVNLKEKSDPTHQFVLLNTHWAWESDEWIQKSVDEEIELIKTLRTRFSLPIFCTGDFNSKQDSAEYNRFMSEAGLNDLCKQAREAACLVNECGGCGNIGSPRSGGNYIDHIFGSGGYTVKRYETVVGNRIHWLSDHAPHYVDIMLS